MNFAGPTTQVAFFLPDLEGGGAERAIVRLANDIADSPCTVDLVLGVSSGPYLTEVSSKVRIVNLASGGKLFVVFRLARYISKCKPLVVMSSLDIANIQLILASWLAGFRGRTVISQRATISHVYARVGRIRRLLYLFGIRFTYPYADLVISNSYAAAREIIETTDVDAGDIVTIHNSVDADHVRHLANAPLNDDWFLKNSSPLIISVGSLTPLKDRITLIKAFSIVKAQKNVRLVILGDGAERAKIESLISDLGLMKDVYLPGFDANPFRWMRRSAVLVSSSLTEGCPNQLLEALSLGVQIVATDCPGDTSEILGRGRWGRLVPVGDPMSMASSILACLDHPDCCQGQTRAADFSPEVTTRAYLDLLLPEYVSRD